MGPPLGLGELFLWAFGADGRSLGGPRPRAQLEFGTRPVEGSTLGETFPVRVEGRGPGLYPDVDDRGTGGGEGVVERFAELLWSLDPEAGAAQSFGGGGEVRLGIFRLE